MVPKSGKDHSEAESYLPIAANTYPVATQTSCGEVPTFASVRFPQLLCDNRLNSQKKRLNMEKSAPQFFGKSRWRLIEFGIKACQNKI